MLGGLRVDSGNRSITRFQTRKAGALLAHLALDPERVHSRDELTEQFWPETDPEAGRASLRTALSSLRRQLEPPGVPMGAVLVADRATVRLNANAVVTDVAEFDSEIESAGRTGKESDRIPLLESAIALYAGDLLPEFYEECFQRERDRLASAHLGALRRLVRDLANNREFDGAIQYARKAVAADTLREESHRDLINLYAAAGQPTAALLQFKELVRILKEEFGSPPSKRTQEIAARLEETLGHGTGARSINVDTSGYENLSATPAASTVPHLSSHAGGLPPLLTRFFGREAELERLAQVLGPPVANSPRLISLVGAGGCGKTRLALESARIAFDAFSGSVWPVYLADLTDARLIPGSLLIALGISSQTRGDPIGETAAFFGDRPALLILDNFEQLVAGGAPIVEMLLLRCRQLVCLVTTRRRLGIPGERVMAVHPLSTPDSEKTPEQLLKFASAELFVDRAQSARPDFQLTASNADAVAKLCRNLEGIPLAIELAAARAQAMTPDQMLERLSQRFELLATRRRDKGSRHSSLWAAIDWSYHLLTAEQQRLFARLSVFRGGFTSDSVEVVCKEPSAPEYLAQLRERSLVLCEETRGELRFRMLESLREYAMEQLTESEYIHFHENHSGYFVRLGEHSEAEVRGPKAGIWLDRLDSEIDNIRVALDWCQTHDRIDGLWLAATLWRFWHVRGHAAEGRKWLTEFLKGAESAPPRVRAKALTSAGILAGSLDAAMSFYQAALETRREMGDPDGISAALSNLGVIAFDRGDYDQARVLYEEALALSRKTGIEWRISSVLNNLGNAVVELGQFELAADYLRESLEITRRMDNRRGMATALNNLGKVLAGHEDLVQAQRCQEESLSLYQELGDKPGIAYAVGSLGKLAFMRMEYALARTYFGESLQMWVELEDRTEIPAMLECFAELAAMEQQFERAIELWGAAEAVRERSGCKRFPSSLIGVEAVQDQAVQMLSAEEADRLMKQGRSIPLDQAIALALQPPS